jgi:hypothetical protein
MSNPCRLVFRQPKAGVRSRDLHLNCSALLVELAAEERPMIRRHAST